MNTTLNIRTVRSQVALLDSHVGEELWDAAKIFCAHLCNSYKSDDPIENNLDDGADTSESVVGRRSRIRTTMGLNLVSGKRLRGLKVLELGAGVGSLGMCAMSLGAHEVLCTDYDNDVLENLEFNLLHNRKAVCGVNARNDDEAEEKLRLRSSKLDWRSFAASDIQSAEWIDTNVDDCDDGQEEEGICFNPDIVLGSALIYSMEGALYCADIVRYFLVEKRAKECWILQMPERPGFDRFLLRLEHWGLSYEAFSIEPDVFDSAEHCMGKISSNVDDFQLYCIWYDCSGDESTL